MRALIPAALAAALLWLPAPAQPVPKFKVLVVGQPDGNHPRTGAAGIKAVQEIAVGVDESSYSPGGSGMPGDHPVMWSNTRHGPMIYTALGHEPEAFANANVRRFLENAIPWAAQGGSTAARAGIGNAGEEIPVLRWAGGRLVYAGGRDAAGRGADRRGLSNRFPW